MSTRPPKAQPRSWFVYELHVKAFTGGQIRGSPASPRNGRGVAEKIPYLKSLGARGGTDADYTQVRSAGKGVSWG